MLFRYEYHGGVWVDLEQPTEDELRSIVREFSLSENIEKELSSPTPAPMVADGGGAALLVLHFPAPGAESEATKNQEVDFVVGKQCIVTVRYEVVAPLHHLKKLFETRDLVAGHESITTDVLLEILFAHLYASVRDHANHLTNCLEHIERDMFDGHERKTVRAISNVSRAFLHLEAELASQEEPLDRFLKAPVLRGFFPVSFEERAERVRAERTQVMRLVKTHRAVATEMRETNNALLEAHQNQIMKALAVLTVIAELLVVAFSALLVFNV